MAKIHFKYSAMNAGKSTMLIQTAFNYKERGMSALVLKPEIDTRQLGVIHSRIGVDIPCTTFKSYESVLDLIKAANNSHKVDAVLIDESQFMTEKQVMELVVVAKAMDIPVICFGLKNDFAGNLFVGSAKLLVVAERLEELKTICWCGSRATQNARVDANSVVIRRGESIEVGDTDRYVPLCLQHFVLGLTKPTDGKLKDIWQEYIDSISKI